MTDKLSIALAQINPTLGDLAGNAAKIRDAHARAAAENADLVVFSELVVTGYPPEDLVLKPALQRAAMTMVRDLATATMNGPAMLVGTPWNQDGLLYNAVALLADGEVKALRFKHDLPNYGVFDEKRVFHGGPMPGPVNVKGVRIGFPICEDMWTPHVAECLAETGAEILIVPNGSPFELDKDDLRLNHAVARVTETGLPLVYLNQVGGQDELVFDGASFVLNADCRPAIQMKSWDEDFCLTHWSRAGDGQWVCTPGEHHAVPDGPEQIYRAMALGLADYVNKNGFPGIVLGLSGGIDSALSAAVAVDALGADRVHAVMMPSAYTSQESLEDAARCAEALGIRYDIIPISPAVAAFGDMLAPSFAGREPDLTEENIQARIRGVTLMALSNKFGHMLLTTGNKSEMSVGYATLYGDMCGGYSVLKDVYKMTVFALSRWRNLQNPGLMGPGGTVIPERIITKPPSAELRPNQTDQDSLPPYEVLDAILEALVEQEKPIAEVIAMGFDAATVQRVEKMLYLAEYKRRQAPPGVKITRRNFGRDRRYPIVNRFRDGLI